MCSSPRIKTIGVRLRGQAAMLCRYARSTARPRDVSLKFAHDLASKQSLKAALTLIRHDVMFNLARGALGDDAGEDSA